MKKILAFFKKELMLTAALAAAVISCFIAPPSLERLAALDWRTLGILFMMLCVLEGFKQENILRPVVLLSSRFKGMTGLSLFLIFGVFFSSMFVTNDVSLIIFVPLTILLFKGGKERYILPVITMENIAAIRGSLLMPFGSPQNLYLFGRSGVSVGHFMLHMLLLAAMSAVLLVIFVLILYRKEPKLKAGVAKEEIAGEWKEENRGRRVMYVILFICVLCIIITRSSYWWVLLIGLLSLILLADTALLKKVDFVLIATFFCFFLFSSSIAAHPGIAGFLKKAVAGNEYWWTIGLSQLISNVPATIVLYPFSENFAGLIYGADTAGLCSLIGSLASVINYRLYVREYPGNGGKFIRTFTLISWAFFLIVVIPGLLLSKWAFF